MSNEFWKDVGQAHEFALACEKVGMKTEHIAILVQDIGKLKSIKKFLEGTAKIVDIEIIISGEKQNTGNGKDKGVAAPLVGQSIDEGITKEKLSIIKIDTIIPALKHNFIAKDNYVVDNVFGISFLWDNFKEWFLPQIVFPRREYKISYCTIVKSTSDEEILSILGNNYEVDIAAIFYLISIQRGKQTGILKTDGNINVFYVRDITKTLRTVFIRWYGGGWCVCSIKSIKLEVGGQVIFRSSC